MKNNMSILTAALIAALMTTSAAFAANSNFVQAPELEQSQLTTEATSDAETIQLSFLGFSGWNWGLRPWNWERNPYNRQYY